MRMLELTALMFALAVNAAEVPRDGGVGVVLGVEGRDIVVKRILPDTPAAAQHDLQVGDRILAVAQDKEPAIQVESGKLAQAVPLLRGPKGTIVRLTILSAGEDKSRAGEVKALSAWGGGGLLSRGMLAPDIEMVSLANGSSERLSAHTNTIIVLEFWATWCGPCQSKLADLQTYSEKYPDWRGKVIVIAASVDDSEEAPRKHLRANGWGRTHNVWVGIDAKRAYHLDAIPTAYVIDRQGKIAAANPEDLSDIVNQQLHTR
jgi:thiol-disulfide isomerase/thioredoxin